MKKQYGFTLIELIVFIIITTILGTTIFLTFVYGLTKAPVISQNAIANLAAQQCAEWFIGERRLNGYNNISCTNPNTPSFCTSNMPTGYTITTTCAATTINSDANYETLTVSVNGKGNATYTFIIGSY